MTCTHSESSVALRGCNGTNGGRSRRDPDLSWPGWPGPIALRRPAPSEELARAGTGDVLATFADRFAVDPHLLDAGAVGDYAVGAGGEIPHSFDVGDADSVGVERHEVAGKA